MSVWDENKMSETLLRDDDDDDDNDDDDNAPWQLASVSDKKQAAAVHCASPMPHFI